MISPRLPRVVRYNSGGWIPISQTSKLCNPRRSQARASISRLIKTLYFDRLRWAALCGCFVGLSIAHAAHAQTNTSPRKTGSAVPVVLVSVDTLRADRLGCYGYRAHPTPNIDLFANHSTLFSAASALVPLTLPSHVSLLTSTYPFSNGIRDNGEQLQPNVLTLASVLKSRGYRTAAFAGGFVLDRRFGLNQGFDFYDSPFDVHRQEGSDPGDIKRLGSDVVTAASKWLSKNSDRPFFVFVHLYDLHTPYNLPPSFRGRQSGPPDYEVELGYVDDVLGHFWKFLRQSGLLDKCLIVFTSDHGEGLGEHGESSHGYFIYDSTIRVPLIFRWPAGTARFPARISTPVSLIDVAPTILQFLGVPQPAQFQGGSLFHHLNKQPSETQEQIYSASEYGSWHFGVSKLRSLRVGDYKYIDAPKPELYNLADDPGETQNLFQAKKPQADTLRQLLLALLSRYGSQTNAGLAQALPPDAIERLHSLGYMEPNIARSDDAMPLPDPKDRIAAFEDYGRGLMLSSFGRVEESSVVFERLLAQFPDLVDVSLCLGFNKQRQGQFAESVVLFKRVLKQNPLSAVAHFDLAVSYYAMRKFDEASKELDATLAIAPYYTRALELLGTMAVERGDYDGGRVRFTEILKFSPDDYAAHVKLGVVATMQAKWDEAELHLKAAIKTDPESAEAHNTLGSVYLYENKLDDAAGELVETIRIDPRFAGAHYNLGLARAKQGRKADAVREFEATLSVDPTFQAAQEALTRIQGGVQ
jgi:choline-sulfatase